jgi:hypothetical protein
MRQMSQKEKERSFRRPKEKIKCNKKNVNIVTWLTINQVWTGNRIYWTFTVVTTNNYDSLTELHIAKIAATAAHIKYSQSSLTVAW